MTSALLRNPPFGYLEQNHFLNGIIILKTNLAPNDFLKNMLRLEKKIRKKAILFKMRLEPWILILFFLMTKKSCTQNLIIPHKDWANRESVIIPLKHL